MSDEEEDIPGADGGNGEGPPNSGDLSAHDPAPSLVTLITANYAAEALVIQSYLRARGLWAEVASIHFHYLMPWMGLSLGGFQVNIRRSDAPRARELIGGVGKDWPLSECPECGASDVVIGQAVLRNAATYLVGSMIAPPYVGKRRCRACGHKWTAHRPKLIHGIGIALLLIIALVLYGGWIDWTSGP